MAFWDKIFGEFVDVIEWTDATSDTMVYRFERYGNEIKYGAMLTVRESQIAVFVNEGQIADIFEPGLYKLDTNNLPILTTLQSWPHGFNSPFKAEVYYFNMRQFTDLKWGTKNPIMLRDKEFGPVRLRSYGTYVVAIGDPVTFLKEVVGTDGRFTTDEITAQLRNHIVSWFATSLGQSGIPILDLAANYDDLSDFVTNKIAPEFGSYGLDLRKLLVENISLPSEVEQALDKRTSMGLIGNLRDYATFQAAEAMTAAAENPAGGGAAAGMGMGMGFGMAKQMVDTMSAGSGGGGNATPPPVPQETPWYLASEGHQTGPFTKAEIRNKLETGDVNRDTLVWRQGLEEWTAAERVDELAAIFAQLPPPVPKG
ncbi:MAG: SPFH domain-containing protein [Gammaproteobacteria bacterium]|nr:SPFH domain-containing protein [Gammaproteobacteria bacterium]NNM21433.1 SPFH domain-containing protein [Gammaproteobacteria bacterium]